MYGTKAALSGVRAVQRGAQVEKVQVWLDHHLAARQRAEERQWGVHLLYLYYREALRRCGGLVSEITGIELQKVINYEFKKWERE